jgi:two-component system nitrogen regulation sensor histidine kinase NtrY
VEVQKDDSELGVLARSMNHMTAQLQTQRDDLVETNKQFDRRRRFTEAVLSGVSAGVVGVDSNGRITIANRSAADIVQLADAKIAGLHISEVLPEAHGLFEAASEPPYSEIAGQIDVHRDGLNRTLSIRIVSDEVEGERSFVVTFDDITQLISAQRSAAWGDIARRIAHEIKNPLTPIQLSAERLRRKYLGEIKNAPEVFDKCTETIIKHVGDIGRMVDEFSSFARMPKPVMADEDIREIVKTAVFSQRVASPEITFDVEAPPESVIVRCDGRLIAQALGNLLKNAAESVGARLALPQETNAAREPGRVDVNISIAKGYARIAVTDNGIGLPKVERHRITEPYMTTRAKGTGLGLAIVKKVVEEHDGALFFEDCNNLGSTGALVSLTLSLAANRDDALSVAAAE